MIAGRVDGWLGHAETSRKTGVVKTKRMAQLQWNDSQAEHRVKIQAALQARTREIRTVMEQKIIFYGFSRVFADIETFSSKHGWTFLQDCKLLS